MSEDTPRVICIGEALIELTRGPDGAFTATCAGDSFNTAAGPVSSGMVWSLSVRKSGIFEQELVAPYSLILPRIE